MNKQIITKISSHIFFKISIRLFFLCAVLLTAVSGYFYFTKPGAISFDLANDTQAAGEIIKSFNALPLATLEAKDDNKFFVSDNLKDAGIKIEYANAQVNEEKQKIKQAEEEKNKFQINFDSGRSLRVSLNQDKEIIMEDFSTEPWNEAEAIRLSEKTTELPKDFSQNETEKWSDKITARLKDFFRVEKEQKNILKYSSQNGRKTSYYGYLADKALGARQLKHWTKYQNPKIDTCQLVEEKGHVCEEKEEYHFTNARLKIAANGDAEVFYYGEQEKNNDLAMAQVEPDLLERARRVLAKDLGENTSQKPDLVIPKPYYIDNQGNVINLDWQITDDGKILKLVFTPGVGQYPIFLDPTLKISEGNSLKNAQTITGGATNDSFGTSLVAGDFNTDGRTDLAVGAYGYNSVTGRAYIFYNDGSMPNTASTADVTITGEATNDLFGISLVAGDFNTDNRTDLVVGARGYTSATGRAYIFYNDGSMPSTASTADVTIAGEATGNVFGYSLVAGDFNADGKTDLAVGAYGYNSGTGRVYIFYNDGSIPTTASTADIIITGEAANNYFGRSLVAGDFNADGKTDLAVGAYAYNSNTGRAYIFYNDGSMPTTAATADVTITGGATSNNFGDSLVAGDFNADGKTDLAVGADGYNSDTGRVYIFYNDGSIPNTASTADVTITGEATGNVFGYSLVAGDFNADGKTDLAVGAYGYSSDTGRAYIFYNDGSIPITAATADIIITGEVANSYFGRSLVVGDFNADGKTDLAVGAYGYNSITGRAYIFYNDGLILTTAATADVTITGEATSDYFGTSLAAGDFNSDGKTDLAVGAYLYNSDTGRAYIFYNDGSIPTTAATADIIITGEAANNYFGRSLVAGDFNTDGKTDLAVGAYGYNSVTGRAYIFYNDGSMPTTAATADATITGEATNNYFGLSLVAGDFNADGKTDLAVGADKYNSFTGRVYVFYNDGSIPTTASTADIIITGATNSSSGNSLASGDFNSDGKTDLAVGAYGYNSNTGRAYIFYNDGSMSTTTATADVTITGATNSSFGNSLTAGDFNSDGKTDLAVSAYRYSSFTGRAYIFYNDGSIPTTAATADVTITGEATSNNFGDSLVAGDFNSDGKTDLAVGADGYGSDIGRAYIFYNDGSIPTTAATADIIITGETGSNNFGTSLAAGDFNSDGKTDLVVGANGYNSNTGRVYVYTFFNKFQNNNIALTGGATNNNFSEQMVAGDFNADGRMDLAVGAKNYNSNTGRVYIFNNDGIYGSADVTLTGSTTNNFFGSSLAAGDFNADGRTDLAVGAYGYSSNKGEVYIFNNDGSIPTTAQTADSKITGSSTGDFFGSSLAAGDINADGKIDLLVGATTTSSGAGRVYGFYSNGTISSQNASSSGLKIDGEALSSFGSIIRTGDFNADSKTDLVVGASAYSTNTGRAYIFYNDGSIPTTAATADAIITGATTSNYFGSALAPGDFNTDGKTDLAIGAYGYNSSLGAAYLFYNDGTYPNAATSADAVLYGAASSTSANDKFGYSLAAGDMNADGKQDLVVGSPGFYANRGAAFIYFNDSHYNTMSEFADIIIEGTDTSGQFGFQVVIGDFTGSGRDALFVGTPGYSTNTGRAYLFASRDPFSWELQELSGTPRVMPYSGMEMLITGEGGNNYFSSSFASGDLNNDGETDLVIGAYGYNNNQGRVYLFYGDGRLPNVASEADKIIYGESGTSKFGKKIMITDVNNDRKSDLIIGADSYNAGQGRVYIFNNDGHIANRASLADTIITGEAVGDYFGIQMVNGDFNADGKNDFLVGATGNNSSRGAVYFFNNDGTIPSSAANADSKTSGSTTNEYFPYALTVGDFNADGKTDFAAGSVNSGSFIGSVAIFYNATSFPASATSANVIINQLSVMSGFGLTLSSADYNFDGETDLAVGAPWYNSNQGRVYIYRGATTFDTVADDTITGEAGTGQFGFSLSSGDYNTDGRVDLAVGAPDYNSNQGKVYLLYNDGSIPSTAASADVSMIGESGKYGSELHSMDFNSDGKTDLIIGAVEYNANQGRAYLYTFDDAVITGGATNNNFGTSLIAGDFNADGRIDLAVGASAYNSYTGRVYIFYNDGSIPNTASTADVTITGETTSNYFGSSLAAGDFNADGKTDLAVGAYWHNSDTGRAYIFYNDGSIPTTAGTADVTITGETTNNFFGYSLAAGDFNTDGRTDLAIGAYWHNSYTGRVYIFYNDGSIPTTASTADVAITGGVVWDYFGYSLAAGDFNADGKTDLAVGANGYDSDTGRAYIFYNDGSIPTTAGTADVTITGEANDSFSYSLVSGDFNADGKTDLTAGAYAYNSNTGRVYIFYNDGSIPTTAATADVIITGENEEGHFSFSLVAGDFNTDGRTDLAVGADWYNSFTGRVYVFYNDGSIPTTAAMADVVIVGEAINNIFGYSLAAGDFNADGKTDLAVGANGYDSDTGRAYIFFTETKKAEPSPYHNGEYILKKNINIKRGVNFK